MEILTQNHILSGIYGHVLHMHSQCFLQAEIVTIMARACWLVWKPTIMKATALGEYGNVKFCIKILLFAMLYHGVRICH